MRKKTRVLWFLLILLVQCYLASTTEGAVQEKTEAAIPVIVMPPSEGNATFLDGTTWCVALPGVSQVDLQNALGWACGLGMADCSAIQEGGLCFEPDTLVSHASLAFNKYYQQNGNSDIACNFGGTATITKHDPSYNNCIYSSSSSGSLSSPAPTLSKQKLSATWWKVAAMFLLLYMRS